MVDRFRLHRAIVAILLASALLACGLPRPRSEELRFVVVRHAEKLTAENAGADFDPNDPGLTVQGEQRAMALATLLKPYPVVAIYTTPFKRTQATVAPSAKTFRLSVNSYDAQQVATDFVATLRQRYQSGTVLIVGHSNTVPAIVAALCLCPGPTLTDRDYGDRFEVVLSANSKAKLSRARF